MESHLLQMRGLKRDFCYTFTLFEQSHLLQMRGLKQFRRDVQTGINMSHLLQMRGLKHCLSNAPNSYTVASFTDAWIETCH